MSFACLRLMTGQRKWILSNDFSFSESAREEEARPIWTTGERDLRRRRVWEGSSPLFGMTSMIPMRGKVRVGVCFEREYTPEAGGWKERLE
jgi:hypothetical protein